MKKNVAWCKDEATKLVNLLVESKGEAISLKGQLFRVESEATKLRALLIEIGAR